MPSDKSDITLIDTQDGSHSLYSEQFGETYHSKYGAIQESLHVFIKAGFHPKMQEHNSFSILDIGFGSGLNAFLTFLEGEKWNKSIVYEAVEAYPVAISKALTLNYPTQLNAKNKVDIFTQMHECEWNVEHQLSSKFSFKKNLKHFEDLEYEEVFDIIYFDAFAPNTQPELWEIPVLSVMYKALRKNGIFVTYSAKGSVKRNLQSVGFTIEKLAGPPGKREMLRGVKG